MKEKKMKMLSAQELYAFSDEMSMMIQSGVSSLEGVTMMLEEARGGDEEAILRYILDTIYETGSFAKGVRDVGTFPDYFVWMVEMGEQTGKTDEILYSLSRHYAREMSMQAAIRNAVTYPLLMVGMMLIVIIVLVTKIMPVFERVFAQLGGTMNGIAGGVMVVGDFLQSYGWIFLIIIGVLALWFVMSVFSISGRRKLMEIAFHIGSFRRIMDKVAVSRFASGIAITLDAGMSVLQALDVSGSIVNMPGFDEKVERCKEAYSEQMDLGRAFSKSGVFKGLYGRMAILGAKTGNLEQVMERIAYTYQEEADDDINNMISVVEPTLVIIMSVVVGIVLLSVMMPLLNIMVGMN